MKKLMTFTWLFFACVFALAQPPFDWYFQDPASSQYNGVAVDRLYSYIGNRAPEKTIVVAILDSGIDIDHEDLKPNIWKNAGEIAGNGIDDDRNGYIDDIHGWNFLGNPNGENIEGETLEITRLYAHYKAYFKDKDLRRLSRKDRDLYKNFLEYERVVQRERSKSASTLAELDANEQLIRDVLNEFDTHYPNQNLSVQFLAEFDPGDNDLLKIARELFMNAQAFGLELSTTEALMRDVQDSYVEVAKESRNALAYRYNPDFKSREIIGDNYANVRERHYGNSDVRGGFAFHGTHVAGIVGAVWNDTGIRGVARDVRIMPVRVVPDGDEHDKDVANAIRYAVDNGAHVINMSFGKGQSWNKKTVDKAVRYARKRDVLLVHGAGNSGENNDLVSNFPNPVYESKGFFGKHTADNWLEVGALNVEKGEQAIAPFSNYGKQQVDIFAPGMYIYSTAPGDTYEFAQGTSMASPVVAGVAAVIRSYFPKLKAHEIKDVLMQSVTPIQGNVVRPGDGVMVPASELSRSGGMVNVYEAFRLAQERQQSGTKKQQKQEMTGTILGGRA
jgi:cell wall-associated protease